MIGSRLQVVCGPSVRLREERLHELLAHWQGPVIRLVEPPDLARVLLDAETPSFLEEAAARVVRCDERYLAKHKELLTPVIGQPVVQGIVVLVVPAVDQRERFAKALAAAEALHQAPVPGPKEIGTWLAERLGRFDPPPRSPAGVVEALVARGGEDVDQLLALAEVAALYALPAGIDAAAVAAISGAIGERPVWEYTNAVLDGQARRALELGYAGEGLQPIMALATLSNELRKLLACCESSNDGDVATWAGLRGRPNLFYARKRARELGQPMLVRLFQGVLQAQRQLRRSGAEPEFVLEMLAVQAARVVRPGR